MPSATGDGVIDHGADGLAPGMIRSGLICGRLALKASSSIVRKYAGWTFEITAPAVEATVTITKIRAYNVPDADVGSSVSDPFVRFTLVNEGVSAPPMQTGKRDNMVHPIFADTLQSTMPAGLVPQLRVQLFDQDVTKESELLATVELPLDSPSGHMKQIEMKPSPKVAKSLIKAPVLVSFAYEVSVSSVPHGGWFQVQLASPTPGIFEMVVWQEHVMRTLAKDNDKDDGNGPLQPMHEAAQEGNAAAIEQLLEDDAPIEARAKCGWTPLIFAVRGGHMKAVEVLLAGCADVKAADAHGSSPLHRCAYAGHVAIIKTLIQAGAEVEAKDHHGRSPLHVAADNGQLAACQALLQAGASQLVKDNDYKTPPELAAACGEQAIVALFEKKKMRPVQLSGGSTKMVLTGSRVLSGSAVLVPKGFPPGYPNYKPPVP